MPLVKSASIHCRLGAHTRGATLQCLRPPYRRPLQRCQTTSNAAILDAVSAKRSAEDMPAILSGEELKSGVPATCVVVGGGPCGLAAAICLSQMGWPDIEVWDKLPPPRPSDDGLWGTGDRSYNNVLKGKAQAVLHDLGLYERVVKCSAPDVFRQEWTPQNPDGKRTYHEPSEKDPIPQVIQRNRLVACMLEHIKEEYAEMVRVRHNMQVQQLAVQPGGKVTLKWSQVGADGAGSTVRTLLEEQGLGEVQTVNLEERGQNTRLLKTIMIPVQGTEYSAPDGSGMCRIAERSPSGRVFESQPTREGAKSLNTAAAGNQLGQVLFKTDDEDALSISTEEEAAQFLKQEFPHIYPLIPRSEIRAFAERPPSQLPTFRYAGPELHYSDNVVLAGDAIHTVKPYFGLGVNSALDDVRWLRQCLEKHQDDRAAALALYSKERALDTQALVFESHKADQSLLQLVFPFVMDTVFNRIFPGFFASTMFKSMGMDGLRFVEVRRRKRLDRTIQLSMIAATIVVIFKTLASVVS